MSLKNNQIDRSPKRSASAREILFGLLIMLCSMAMTNSVLAANLTIKVADKADGAVENTVVYLEAVNKTRLSNNQPTPASIEQKGRKFFPFVTVVQTGSNISFPNRDTVRHHVYSFSPAKTFELKLYKDVPAAPVTFDKPGTVILGCNIHDQMVAFIHIVDTPYFAKTDHSGKAILSNVPNGAYNLKVWHYALAEENKVVEKAVSLNGDQQIALTLELKPFVLPK